VRTIEPVRALAAEALALEHQISDLVNAAYGLTERGDRPDVANGPAPHADRAGMISAPAVT
jgi:hypothetical protein